jgi:signal transduction histidine kinase
MNIARTWLLPVLLAAGQVAWWPGSAWLLKVPAPARTVAVVLLASALAAAGLGLRRRAPFVALAGVGAVLTAVELAVPDTVTFALIQVAGPVALYSVAARRTLRVAFGGAAVLTALEAVVAVIGGFDGEAIFDLAATAALLGVVLVFGRGRYRWRAARQEAADRLARAEAEHRDAAAVERQRLARELHDVAAHHLTSIVVTAAAAERLVDQPHLVARALAFAANTGRETLAALHRLVAVMDTDAAPGTSGGTGGGADPDAPALPVRIHELADAFGRLGQRVSVTATDPGPVPVAVADAVYGIVREALTNALRYARGAPVTVCLDTRPDALELTVDNDGGAGPGTDAGPIGSGRGLTGMRERAAALGGSVEAGPRPDGGFTVRTFLPLADAAPEPAGAPRRRQERLADAAVVLAAGAGCFVLAGGGVEGDGLMRPATLALLVLLAGVHAVPLAWRRRFPWRVLALVIAANGTWSLVVGLHVLPQDVAYAAPGSLSAYLATYAVARYARSTWLTWLSLPVTAIGVAAAHVTPLTLDGSIGGLPVNAGLVVLFGAMSLELSAPVAFAVWGAGLGVRQRRDHVFRQEHGALALAAARAAHAAHDERGRIGVGLRDSVLDLAGRSTAAADAGRQAVADGDHATACARLNDCAELARAGLAAMRELLDVLRPDTARAERAPQPTVAGIAQLCEDQRGVGRPVTLRALGAWDRLPAEVDVSAYRIVAAALAAGDTGPAVVILRRRTDDLWITVRGVPAATAGPVAAGLRERVAAFRGSIALDPAGTVDVSLPACAEEVAPSSA